MRILYGISGEGFGHSSRARPIINHLRKRGHKVLIFTYGQAYEALKDLNPVKIEGVKILYRREKLHLTKTVSHNFKKFVKNYKKFTKTKKIINEFKPDICISDMELFVPIISRIYKLPLISIDNHHQIVFSKLKIPKSKLKDFLIVKTATSLCTSTADYFIVLSFTKEPIKDSNVFLVSPILREEIIKKRKSKQENFILIYQTKKDKKFIKTLKRFYTEKFILYGWDQEKKEENILFKKTSPKFIEDLAKCKAVIATAGFSLISEAVFLKKPFFAMPLKGQFEQFLNGVFIKKAKFGSFSEKPTKKQIERFLNSLKEYKKNLKKYKINPNEAEEILDKILKEIKISSYNKIKD